MTTNFTLRRASERFHTKVDWLDSYHTFSFGEHYDPAHLGYRSLRVINDDIIAPGKGFGMHPHASMEIFTYVISGQLEHRDSMGNGRIIGPGEFQYMSAGDGVKHSETNPSLTEAVHLLQIWINPSIAGGEPRYADRDIASIQKENCLTLLASPTGQDDSFAIRQHDRISFGHLASGSTLTQETDTFHHYLHLISGEINIDKTTLNPGDGVSIEGKFEILANADSEFLLFSLH